MTGANDRFQSINLDEDAEVSTVWERSEDNKYFQSSQEVWIRWWLQMYWRLWLQKPTQKLHLERSFFKAKIRKTKQKTTKKRNKIRKDYHCWLAITYASNRKALDRFGFFLGFDRTFFIVHSSFAMAYTIFVWNNKSERRYESSYFGVTRIIWF